MIVIIMLLVLSLAGFCILSAEDLVHKTKMTVHSWIIVIFITAAIVGCLFICGDWVRTQAIKDYTDGKYRLEEVVRTDTSYTIKRIEK